MLRGSPARTAAGLLSVLALTLTLLGTSSTVGPVAPAWSAAPTIQVSAPAVAVKGTLVVSGQARRGRSVTLQMLRAGRWETVAVTEATSSGTYSLRAPTWWLGLRKVRVWTPSSLLSSGGYSPVVSYQVVPRYRPAGRSTAYRIDLPGYRWNPCRVIGWKFNPNGGNTRLLNNLHRAFARVSAATGLRFAYEGTTSRIGGRHAAHRARTEILVSWATPQEIPSLAGNKVGVARTDMDPTKRQYVGGSIALDRTHRLRYGFAATGRPTWGQVSLHEIAHVIGLGHVSGGRQVLYQRLQSKNHRFGAGDLAGLRRLGADGRCLS